MKYQLRFTQTGMTDIHLLARSRGLKLDDYEGMADLVEALVRDELDKLKPTPSQAEKGSSNVA